MACRIAVLDNNPADSPFALSFPNDGQKVVAALSAARPQWQFQVFDAKSGQLPQTPADHDALVLTGSVASVNDDAPWIRAVEQLVQRAHLAERALVGFCFGHQLIAKALGGRVGPSPGGWRIGTATTTLKQVEPWMAPPLERFTLFAAHQEQVLMPPPGARVAGGDAWAPHGALRMGRHVFTTQYHPELSREFMRGLLDALGDEFPPAAVAQGRPQIEHQAVDAALFVRWVAQFIESTLTPLP